MVAVQWWAKVPQQSTLERQEPYPGKHYYWGVREGDTELGQRH